MPKISDPFKIYNANNLRTGLVVYLTKDFSWSENFADALIVEDDAELIAKCEAEGARAELANDIVAPYWMPTLDGTDAGMHMRERMRVSGPTVGTDQ